MAEPLVQERSVDAAAPADHAPVLGDAMGEAPPADAGSDSHAPPAKPRRKKPIFDEASLLARSFWTVPESAFICRVGARTVWRLMSDPDSGFPTPRRIRGRTLLARDEVLAFLREGAGR